MMQVLEFHKKMQAFSGGEEKSRAMHVEKWDT